MINKEEKMREMTDWEWKKAVERRINEILPDDGRAPTRRERLWCACIRDSVLSRLETEIGIKIQVTKIYEKRIK